MATRPLHTPQGYGCELDAALEIPKLAVTWAKIAPGMLVVDRGSIDFSGGARQMHPMPYNAGMQGNAEAYLTPEGSYQFKTDPKLPWETCLTMGPAWAFTNNSYQDNSYRSAGNVVSTLVDVIAKGGNLLLDVGPDEQGALPDPAVQQLKKVGEWLSSHGVAVYDTTPLWPYTFNITKANGSALEPPRTPPETDRNVTQLRLVRGAGLSNSDVVYIHVLLDSTEPCWRLPLPLPLPFVIDGGIDGTWPRGVVQSVILVGEPAEQARVPFVMSPSKGLRLEPASGAGCLTASPYVATLAIEYGIVTGRAQF